MPPDVLPAASTPWPAVLVGIAALVAICLWLLFRPGSMADRARHDHPDDEGAGGDAGQAPSGGA